MTIVTDLELEIPRVSAAISHSWELTLREHSGRCCLRWSTTAPFRTLQGRLCIYAGTFPADPATHIKACCRDDARGSQHVTELPWGRDWCAAWITRSAPDGPYVYLVKTGLAGADS